MNLVHFFHVRTLSFAFIGLQDGEGRVRRAVVHAEVHTITITYVNIGHVSMEEGTVFIVIWPAIKTNFLLDGLEACVRFRSLDGQAKKTVLELSDYAICFHILSYDVVNF